MRSEPSRACAWPLPLPQVFNEDRKQINGLLLVHLPDGPTAQFRLSNLVMPEDIRVRGGRWACGPGATAAVARAAAAAPVRLARADHARTLPAPSC